LQVPVMGAESKGRSGSKSAEPFPSWSTPQKMTARTWHVRNDNAPVKLSVILINISLFQPLRGIGRCQPTRLVAPSEQADLAGIREPNHRTKTTLTLSCFRPRRRAPVPNALELIQYHC